MGAKDAKMGLFLKFINQTRKPEGLLGKIMLNGMNFGHAKCADWGLSRLPAARPAKILELGCGGGRNARAMLAAFPGSRVDAIDVSPLAVAKTAKLNAAAVAAGRCSATVGDVAGTPLPSGAYDLATAFETVYFWKDLAKCFARVRDALAPGGLFLICDESDGTDAAARQYERMIEGMKTWTAPELEAALKEAGFSAVRTAHHDSKPWIAVVATK